MEWNSPVITINVGSTIHYVTIQLMFCTCKLLVYTVIALHNLHNENYLVLVYLFANQFSLNSDIGNVYQSPAYIWLSYQIIIRCHFSFLEFRIFTWKFVFIQIVIQICRWEFFWIVEGHWVHFSHVFHIHCLLLINIGRSLTFLSTDCCYVNAAWC